MKWRTIISFCLMMLAAAGCMKEDAEIDGGYSFINGRITDSEGTPLEHIKVTLQVQGSDTEVVYTSSDGMYMAIFEPKWDKTGTMTIGLTIEDIDSDANGGIFATLSDNIMIYKENSADGVVTIEKGYRLSPATL